jgi:hypothetical protein
MRMGAPVASRSKMTDKRDLKRRVRERMDRTGESYMTALRHVTAQREPVDEFTTLRRLEPAPSIPYIELIDLDELAKTFAIRCRVSMYPSLVHDIDPREALAALCLLLGRTRDDRAFDVFRDVVIAGEKPRIRLEADVDAALQFAARVRAGFGGISRSGRGLAHHVDGKRGKQLLLFTLQLSPDFLPIVREPTLVIGSVGDTIGIESLISAVSMRGR